MIIADTDVLIDFLRDASPVSDRIEVEIKHGLATTVISAFELWSGSVGSIKRERAVNILLNALKIISLNEPSAKQAAQLRYELQTQGRTIGMADSLIAGICVENRAILLTRNKKHFRDIPLLVLGAVQK